jgi:hypothetical protein
MERFTEIIHILMEQKYTPTRYGVELDKYTKIAKLQIRSQIEYLVKDELADYPEIKEINIIGVALNKELDAISHFVNVSFELNNGKYSSLKQVIEIGIPLNNKTLLIYEKSLAVEKQINELPTKIVDSLNSQLEQLNSFNRIQKRKNGICKIIDLRQNW